MLVYDIEIMRPPVAVPEKPNYQYANGWNDYKGMGIAVLSTYSYKTHQYCSFRNETMRDFIADEGLQKLLNEHEILIGYNHIHFDNNILSALEYKLPKINYDILQQLWVADGLSPIFDKKIHGGYSLDAVVRVNIPNEKKTMNGADAPYEWQDGKYDKVTDYCMHDVYLTKSLMDLIFLKGGLISPKKKILTQMSIPICF